MCEDGAAREGGDGAEARGAGSASVCTQRTWGPAGERCDQDVGEAPANTGGKELGGAGRGLSRTHRGLEKWISTVVVIVPPLSLSLSLLFSSYLWLPAHYGYE